ncbi:MAG: hypothetical protein KY475_02395 [Planctomycetes bacterium]|nr:hypothetical protein [Planctomycetota bacterium]
MSNDKAALEQQVREVLSSARDAMTLSDRLFSPQGLFNQIASSAAERRELASSSLFKDSLRRLSELQRAEADEFARNIGDLGDSAAPCRFAKLERS